MPSRKSKAQKPIDRTPPGSPTSSDNELPEVDLISLDAPEPVDLGDFNAVWRFIASLPPITCSSPASNSTIPDDVSSSQNELLKTASGVKHLATINVSPNQNITTHAPSMSALPTPDRRTKSESLGAKSPHSKTMPAFAYSSPEDDGEDDTSLCSSSYEDKKHQLLKPRHKSFLYVPPTFSSPLIPLKPATVIPPTPTMEDRHRTLIQKLISKYPDEINQIVPPPSLSPTTSAYLESIVAPTSNSPDLHIFIDNSNILIGFYDTYKTAHKIKDPFMRSPKFNFHAFSAIIERGRPVTRKILVGSNPLIQPVALAQHLGYEVSILERVVDSSKRLLSGSPYSSDSATRTPREKKKEQAVDEVLHLKILECLLDVATPATIVLATGDAAPAEFSREGGFLKCIQRALMRGWHVELVCWKKSMSRLWTEKLFRIQWRDSFSVVELDDYVDELVLEGWIGQ
jgi:hypothetical protein